MPSTSLVCNECSKCLPLAVTHAARWQYYCTQVYILLEMLVYHNRQNVYKISLFHANNCFCIKQFTAAVYNCLLSMQKIHLKIKLESQLDGRCYSSIF